MENNVIVIFFEESGCCAEVDIMERIFGPDPDCHRIILDRKDFEIPKLNDPVFRNMNLDKRPKNFWESPFPIKQ